MRLTTLFTYCLCIPAIIVDAAASYDKRSYNKEVATKHQIAKWRHQYSRYIEATIKTRESGCTSKNIVYRQEWLEPLTDKHHPEKDEN